MRDVAGRPESRCVRETSGCTIVLPSKARLFCPENTAQFSELSPVLGLCIKHLSSTLRRAHSTYPPYIHLRRPPLNNISPGYKKEVYACGDADPFLCARFAGVSVQAELAASPSLNAAHKAQIEAQQALIAAKDTELAAKGTELAATGADWPSSITSSSK